MIYDGLKYEFVRVSDIVRDGMFLEVRMMHTDPLLQLAEVFYSDITHQFKLTCYESNIPLAVIEILIEQAKKLLPSMR